jgi:hypothetical protein
VGTLREKCNRNKGRPAYYARRRYSLLSVCILLVRCLKGYGGCVGVAWQTSRDGWSTCQSDDQSQERQSIRQPITGETVVHMSIRRPITGETVVHMSIRRPITRETVVHMSIRQPITAEMVNQTSSHRRDGQSNDQSHETRSFRQPITEETVNYTTKYRRDDGPRVNQATNDRRGCTDYALWTAAIFRPPV